ncbi:MAG: hypothetical protein RLZZ528_715 [Pseudomonadota bacterium]
MTEMPQIVPTLAATLAARGYDTLTPVQLAVLDPGLGAADLLVSAQTGSGKTVGFGLAIAPTILDEAGLLGPAASPLALVIAPTRELALQVKRELGWLYEQAGATMASCVGGMDMRDERRALDRGAHIVVATPGRLRDHIQRTSIDLTSVRAVVLDEADEMLDLGFREDLEFILGQLPETRRTLMFSATVPRGIALLAQSYQKDAVRITTVTDREQHADIAYRALVVAPVDVENAVVNVLRYYEAPNAIVFCNTRATVARLATRLTNRAFPVVALSGELSQTERTHALQAMRDGRARVCVATDVAARGIDLPNLDLVIHAELPTNADTLLHRSGRTGRAGRKGTSALIVPRNGRKRAENLLRYAKVEADWGPAPSADEVMSRDDARLMTDPVWTDAPAERDADLAMQILDRFSPEQIAAAFVQVYRGKRSAPEELMPPDAKGGERPPFGPSRWFALSIGRDRNAEAKWLLPMICRKTGLTRDEIGAIRMQDSETWVEVLESRADRLDKLAASGEEFDTGITIRPLPASPYGDRPRPRDDAPAAPSRPGPRFDAGPKKPHRGKTHDAPRDDGFRKDAPRTETPRTETPRKDMPAPRPHVVKPRPPAPHPMAAPPTKTPPREAPPREAPPAAAPKATPKPRKPATWTPDSAAAVLSEAEAARPPKSARKPGTAKPGKPGKSFKTAKPGKPGKPSRAARKAAKAPPGGNDAPRRRGR